MWPVQIFVGWTKRPSPLFTDMDPHRSRLVGVLQLTSHQVILRFLHRTEHRSNALALVCLHPDACPARQLDGSVSSLVGVDGTTSVQKTVRPLEGHYPPLRHQFIKALIAHGGSIRATRPNHFLEGLVDSLTVEEAIIPVP